MSGNQEKNDSSKKGKVKCGDLGKSMIQTSGCNPPVRNITHPLRYYEFTRDEIKALEECDKESFYRRCLPFSTLFAAATYTAIKYGVLKGNPELGAFPKMLIAGLFGHFYGRYDYIPHCEDKLRQLPSGSYLGNVMRNHYCERMKKQHPSAK